MALLGYQPPLFDYRLEKVAVLSVWANLWVEENMEAGSLLSPSLALPEQANRHRVPAPVYPYRTKGTVR